MLTKISKNDLGEIEDILEKFENMFQEKITTLHYAIEAIKRRPSADVISVINCRQNYMYYRELLWELKRLLKGYGD